MNLLLNPNFHEVKSNVNIYWEYVDVVGHHHPNIPIEVTREKYFTIQVVDSIEQIKDSLFTIKGYSLKEVENNKIRLFKQTVKYAQLRDGRWFAVGDEDYKFAVAETVWEKDRDV